MNEKKLLQFCHILWQKIFLFIALSCYSVSYTQEIAPIWYFGNNAGLDFNDGAPVAILNGELVSMENSAVLTDAEGNLMFYTNGETVWDKNNDYMINGFGLHGSNSSAQGVIIVQKPGSDTIFYIFTVDTSYDDSPYYGLSYSEVDMSLNGGLGDVTDNKNIFITTDVGEMLISVKHSNGEDMWLVAVGLMDNSIKSVLVTGSGVSMIPIISEGGPALIDNTDRIGCMKASPAGDKIAHCHGTSGTQLVDFNNTTGAAEGYTTLTTQGTYGVEFSPSGKLLYVSPNFGMSLLQYNLEAVNIPDSAIPIGSDIVVNGALQLATDGKIYFSQPRFFDALDVINNPDVLGTGCNFQEGAVSLEDGTTNFGLPISLKKKDLPPMILANNFCLGDATEFSISSTVDADSITWNFDDGGSSTEVSPSHTYDAVGTYVVTASFEINGEPLTLEKTIVILETPTATQPPDMTACGNESGKALFDLSTLSATILGPEQAVEYHVGFFTTLEDAHAGTNYISTEYTNTTNPQTIYARVSPDAGICHAVTSFVLNVIPKPVINMPDAYTFCGGTTITLTAPAGFDSYLWSTGATTQSITVPQAGAYTVTVTDIIDNTTCEISKTLTVTESAEPEITHITINDWTDNSNSIIITAQGGNDLQYSIDGVHYQASPVFDGLLPGRYTVYVEDKIGCGMDKETILLLMYPRFFTPNGDGENETWNIKYAAFEPDMLVYIFDRYGKLIKSFKGGEPGWDGRLNGYNLPSTDYWFVVVRSSGEEHKGHFSMIR